MLHLSVNSKSPARLVLAANTGQGLLYGVSSLVDRLHFNDESLVVSDIGTKLNPTLNVPLFTTRGIATNLGGPDWLGNNTWENDWKIDGGYDWKGFVDWVAEKKINNLNLWIFTLAFGIAYDSQAYPEAVNRHHPNVKKEFMSDLIEYAHRRHMSIHLMVDFPDNWTAILKAYPELAGANINVADIPDGADWELYQKSGEGRNIFPEEGESFRRKFSWVCAGKSETMDFWRGYWNELLEKYPGVDGIGGQWTEHPKHRCTCPGCTENFHDLQWRFFEEMARIGQSKNSGMAFWAYRSWGAKSILANRTKLPNLTWIDWGTGYPPFLMRRSIPRGDWYLYHNGRADWPEYGESICCRHVSRLGIDGYQRRAVHYREKENIYQAFKEFSWNPDLSVEEYAHLYVLKELRREEPKNSEAYASWIRAVGYFDLLSYAKAGQAWYERERYADKLGRCLERTGQLLAEIETANPFVQRLRRSFDERRDAMMNLA